MNVCHWDAGHQDQQWTLYLLQDQFWWPSMTTQMQKVISSCKWCIHHKGTCAKVPMQPIITTGPLELLHVDFTSIEMTMKLDQPPNMASILVFFDHFTKHIMAYMPPNQTAKTVAKFLWQWYVCIFGALQNSWVTEVPILKAASSRSCLSSWVYGRFGLHLTMLKPMDRLSELTKCWCTW